MTSLATTYLGLSLAHPIVPGASPLGDDIDKVLALEDAGASAIVMRSIFEEQIAREQLAAHRHFDVHADAEARSVFPETSVFALGLDTYLDQIRRIRERTSLKVIASLNGTSRGGWIDYARRIEQAGAEALELNLYAVVADPKRNALEVEREELGIVRDVREAVRLPLAVKLSPFYTALPHFVRSLDDFGVRGAVLFNRFYQSDIDPVHLESVRQLHLSTPDELLLRLRWLAILSPQAKLQLAVSGGVHAPRDAVKAIMAGAHVVQVVSTLLRHGPSQLRLLIEGVRAFLEEQEYPSLDAMRGNMNAARSPDPGAYERTDYMQLLQSWHGRFGSWVRTK
ncbi:MAG: dihydroorotate dehydrogenase-like protein [Polyangiaceae bacterium]|jgi:dihydroorotate dehydrogenase (fumarate)